MSRLGSTSIHEKNLPTLLFLFIYRPTELDALVFGHLFSIFTMTLPNNVLAVTINQFKNLTKFCKNIEEKYFKMAAGVH